MWGGKEARFLGDKKTVKSQRSNVHNTPVRWEKGRIRSVCCSNILKRPCAPTRERSLVNVAHGGHDVNTLDALCPGGVSHDPGHSDHVALVHPEDQSTNP
jgi:hypothetical protein